LWARGGRLGTFPSAVSAAIAAIREQNELAGLRVQKIEHKAVDQFDSMTDEELRQYVYGDKELDS
jgi:hypothetical protein